MSGKDFCAAVAAAKLQLEAGLELEALFCPHCKAPHLDERAFAIRPHHCHQCQECGKLWEAGHYGVGNPLINFNPCLVSGLVALELPQFQ